MPNAQQAVWQKSGVRAKLKASSSYAANAVRIGFFCNLANGSQHWLRSCKIEAFRFDFPLLRQAAGRCTT
jgi:hypothetical protein